MNVYKRFRDLGIIVHIIGLLGLSVWGAAAAQAADPRFDRSPPNNRGVVQLVTGGSAGASIRIAEDLASVFDDGATRRLLPVIGRNALQNYADLTVLRGIDLAILQADVLDGLRQQRGAGTVDNTFTYIAKLYNEEFHLLARDGINSVADLARRKVNIDVAGSGTVITAERLFQLLGVQVDAQHDRQEVALERLRKGEIDAMAFVAGKPSSLFLGHGQYDGLHFVSIPTPANVTAVYTQASLTNEDYPNLVKADAPVTTVAVGTMLAAANLAPDSDRNKAINSFVEIVFTQFPTLLEAGHHPKWKETDLFAELPGWKRFPAAQQWLDRNKAVPKPKPADTQAVFSRFLNTRQQAIGSAPSSDSRRQELFDEYQKWQASQGQSR